ADHAHAELVDAHLDVEHVEGGDALGDAHDQLDARFGGFEDRVLAAGGRDVDHRGVGPGGGHGFLDGVEHRQAEVGGATLAGGDAAHHVGAVGDGLFGVEGAL